MHILSPEERHSLLVKPKGSIGKVIAKAEQKHTLHQVIEWGNECCFHSGITAYDVAIGAELPKKHTCSKCWAGLTKEGNSG